MLTRRAGEEALAKSAALLLWCVLRLFLCASSVVCTDHSLFLSSTACRTAGPSLLCFSCRLPSTVPFFFPLLSLSFSLPRRPITPFLFFFFPSSPSFFPCTLTTSRVRTTSPINRLTNVKHAHQTTYSYSPRRIADDRAPPATLPTKTRAAFT